MTYENAVDKVVDFWVEKSFKTSLNQNNGDESSMGGMVFVLMNLNSMVARDNITDDKIELFKKRLKESLMEKEAGYDSELDVDYHPCSTLSDAATYAGIDPKCFPCKTFTRITLDNKVEAKYQYRGEIIIL